MNTARHRIRWFLTPWAVGFVLLTLMPALGGLGLSLTTLGSKLSLAQPEWVGLQHYRDATGFDSDRPPSASDPWYSRAVGATPRDPRFYQSLANSLFYTLIAVPLGVCTSLVVAILLGRPRRGATLFRAMVYLPHLLGGAATVLIWSWLLNPQFGWVNELIRTAYAWVDPVARLFTDNGTANWPTPRWLHSPSGCKPALILMYAWTMGGSMLVFLAAIQRIPRDLYGAADLDGASPRSRLWHITLPHVSPLILFNLVVGVIFAMQAFHEPYLLQNREQEDGLLFLVLYIYEAAFEAPYRLGYAAALAWILFAVLLVLVVPLMLTARRWVFEASESQH